MNVTPEAIRAEMDYRLDRALASAELAHVGEARRLHRPWWRRVFGNRTAGESHQVNEARFAA